MTIQILVAPAAFKGTMGPRQVAEALSAGIRRAVPEASLLQCPISDGGDGLLDAVLGRGSPREPVSVTGPLGAPVRGVLGWVDAETAIFESATASGIALLRPGQLDPLRATTRGVGELVWEATERGAKVVVVGLGGSATVDGGTGAARGLGWTFLDAHGEALPEGGGSLAQLADLGGGWGLGAQVLALSDVTTPLIGSDGAAPVFAPQKGAGLEGVELLSRGLERLAELMARHGRPELATLPGGGAAGGLGAGLAFFAKASLVPGAEWVLDRVGFDAALAKADLVVTGEGSFDRTSLVGKASGVVVRRAQGAKKGNARGAGEGEGPTGVHALHGDRRGLDAAILMHPKVWEASGHLAGFVDPLVDCKQCKNRFRADDPRIKGTPGEPTTRCPVCGNQGTLTAPRMFNLMFKTFMGPVEEAAAVVYLRPETAQGVYASYLNLLQSSRQKIPFGIAQVGKAFRNEITPGNFIFRTREFEQMEMQFFVKPGTDAEWFEFWRAERMKWLVGLGLHAEKLRFHQHTKEELAHYAKDAYDIQYEFPFGWQEFEGVHNRTNFDLSRHQEFSGKKLEYVDAATNERYIPYVVETSAGADRTTLVVMVDAYHEEEIEGDKRVVLRIHPAIAPLKAAVFPLVNKDGMPELARRLYDDLRRQYNVFYDDGGSIGRRYRRQDEAGTPFGITVDGQSTADGTVTVRDRDTLAQVRVATDRLVEKLAEGLKGWWRRGGGGRRLG